MMDEPSTPQGLAGLMKHTERFFGVRPGTAWSAMHGPSPSSFRFDRYANYPRGT
jgi:hypothetical protein